MAIVATPSLAQDWQPTRPLTMVVPFAAGGQVDVLGRVLARRGCRKSSDSRWWWRMSAAAAG